MARDPYRESPSLKRAGNLLQILGWLIISGGVAIVATYSVRAGSFDFGSAAGIDLLVVGAAFLLVGSFVHILGRATGRWCDMTTHTDTREGKNKARPPSLRKLWAVLATLAAMACAFVVIGKFTWGSELYDGDSYWVSADAAFWAGLGVLGFTGLAIRMWQPPRDEEPLWSRWLDAAFWTYFAVGMVVLVIWQASRVGDDNGIGWPMVLLLGFFAILTLWGAIESWLKAWKASHTHPGRGAAVH